MNIKKEKDSLNPVADQVEKSIKEKSQKAEEFVKNGMGILEEVFSKLLEVRPKEIKLKEMNHKERGEDR
ncbi:MAG: hypothetical protein CMD85_01590 [Gammaproteobacteria bacterium]|nr:hypothetical protein [Gammaproteobacteria bacterium]|tara:strand:+ start:1042 stop:1248 length:207 start_codon:yes stop_codon:yes gene_type:complete